MAANVAVSLRFLRAMLKLSFKIALHAYAAVTKLNSGHYYRKKAAQTSLEWSAFQTFWSCVYTDTFFYYRNHRASKAPGTPH